MLKLEHFLKDGDGSRAALIFYLEWELEPYFTRNRTLNRIRSRNRKHPNFFMCQRLGDKAGAGSGQLFPGAEAETGGGEIFASDKH